jgi:hypothetical protein
VTGPTSVVVKHIVLNMFDYWTRGTVGLFGYATIAVPVWVIVVWGAMQGMLVLLGFGFAGRRRHAYTILAVPVACYGIGLVVELMMARIVGYFMQGRYFLPLWVGMFFLAALAIPARALPATLVRRIYVVCFGIWSASMLLGLYLVINHYRYGRSGQTEFPQTWMPVLGVAPPAVATLIGITLLGWLVWRNILESEPLSGDLPKPVSA